MVLKNRKYNTHCYTTERKYLKKSKIISRHIYYLLQIHDLSLHLQRNYESIAKILTILFLLSSFSAKWNQFSLCN